MRESFDVWGCDAVQEGPKLAQSELCKSRVAVIASTGNNTCAIGRDRAGMRCPCSQQGYMAQGEGCARVPVWFQL